MSRMFVCRDCPDGKNIHETDKTRGPLPIRCDPCKVKIGTTLHKTHENKTPRLSTANGIVAQTRARRAVEMRRDGHTWEQIAESCGYSSRGAAFNAVRMEMERVDSHIERTLDEIRQKELAHLEFLSSEALKVLQNRHLVVNSGAVVTHRGEELLDDAPSLAAVDRLVKISESRRKLLGLDAAQKVAADVTVNYTVEGIPQGELP